MTTATVSTDMKLPVDLPKPPGLHWNVRAHQPVDYSVRMVRGLLDLDNPALARACGGGLGTPQRCLLAIDAVVDTLYRDRFTEYFAHWQIEPYWQVVQGDEDAKYLDQAVRVTEAMSSMGILRRAEKVIAIGGGVVLDIVGFAASMYRRGIPYVRIPTTLVGQIDAGIGVKTGINYGHHKNRLGAYFAPELALIDPNFLRTIEPRHVANGLAEIIKMALVKDAALFDLLETAVGTITPESLAVCGSAVSEVLSRAISGMLDELEPNLWEQVLERSVDYGHTFSPSLELRADPPLLHGEAVAVDMAICVAVAHLRGHLSRSDADRVLKLLQGFELPVSHPVFTRELLEEALADAVKHRDGLQRVPLTEGIGSVVFANDLTGEELGGALEFIESWKAGTDADLVGASA
ncbi:sedoheptulose 7-phosphate cyclase [Streptomyces sp. NBC_01218]|uniref:sedoheptulose 7-phosphate cyclase n=1 Tax=unclassified Streptomyces TaxID=2593676 RepID=UPI0023B8FE0D|nr:MULTISPECIES: sedoheptulose 7-phosphate cyclase [unclassified Streptomyces]WEH39244.1 sedoheptulose 7-phosphate cyclase [Streptomyces sp. AM 2-1-1]WSQ50894.1 sedoheptulose 7-phosphate cyclase [Streptomyces sp. NBC_01218]